MIESSLNKIHSTGVLPDHNSERTAIYIDGNNFRGYLKDDQINFPNVAFDYGAFAVFLARGRQIISKRYYVGTVRDFYKTDKGKEMVRSQQKFLAGIENSGYAVKRGRLAYDKGGVREKGVDVKIAIDLVVGAIDDLYDTAFL